MRKVLAVVGLLLATTVDAVEYDCTVTRKLDGERIYADEQLKTGQFSVRITDDGKAPTIARCSFSPSVQKVTCDTFEVDRVASDTVAKVMDGKLVPGEFSEVKKYYRFRGQLDVQLFPSLDFVENNGRGGIAYGKCRVASP